MRFLYACCILLLCTTSLLAQSTTLSGNVKNSSTGEPVIAASVLVKGNSTIGTFTDEKGNFKFTIRQAPPLTLIFSSIGYATQEVALDKAGETISVSLLPEISLGREVVVSASRTPERILESPVTIQRVSAATIASSPASSYYDVIGNLNGVDISTSSLTFKTPSTRGFNASGNTRFNQIVDGMDNQAPGLNFAVGSLVGPTELDIDNMELLNGASSALYGPGGMNGTLLINSKNPFKYQGLSVQVKGGVNHINDYARDASPYMDASLRWGYKVSEKFAFKISGEILQAKDWIGRDTGNYLRVGTDIAKTIPGTRASDPNYDGVNVYGDETTTDFSNIIRGVLSDPANAALVPILSPYTQSPNTFYVSRTGYKESDVIDPTTRNIKATGGLYYMISPNTELSAIVNYGTGNSVYTGTDRYSLKKLEITQYKLEAKSKNWFLRAYTTQENAGESFNAATAMRILNEGWSPSITMWYPQFTNAFVGQAATVWSTVYGQTLANNNGNTAAAAAAAQQAMLAQTNIFLTNARATADAGRPAAGSAAFNRLFDSVRLKPIPQGGLFVDHTALYMGEGQYNLTNLLNIDSVKRRTDVLVGANYKLYRLNSEGTLFADSTGPIPINEFGAYLQIQQKLLGDVLKLTASGRYDKNENFKGRFTPRISAVIQVAKDHHIRLSYQTAYRFPTTQQQYINLYVGSGYTLIGGLPTFRDFYRFDTNPIYTLESYTAYQRSPTKDLSLLVEQPFGDFKPESCSSYEIGYKGLIKNKLLIDIYGYHSEYKNFIGRLLAFQSSTTKLDSVGVTNANRFSIVVNSEGIVKTQGWGASLQYLLPRNFNISANLYSDEIKSSSTNFITGFNTPKYRSNIGFGNTGFLGKNAFGFNVIWRWQDKFYYEGDFTSGPIKAFSTLDAQVSYKLSKNSVLFKLGATNLTNHYYINAHGNPAVGALYYLSATINVL